MKTFYFSLFTEYGFKDIQIELKNSNSDEEAKLEFCKLNLFKILSVCKILKVKEVSDQPTIKLENKKIIYLYRNLK